MAIHSRMPRIEYDAIEALNMSRLKEIKRSPLHYWYALTHAKTSGPLTLGTATHVAVLEPERYNAEFAVWDRRTDGGNSAPRKGQHWDAFKAKHEGQTVLTLEQHDLARAIAKAVRDDDTAMRYLGAGDPEVTLEWELGDRKCKGRVDWLTAIESRPFLVGLKTSRDCRHFAFGSQAAKLGYHLAWSWYHDGHQLATKRRPELVEIVVESEPPHAVATYRIPDDIIEQGRDEYTQLLEVLKGCEQTDNWPGPVPLEETLSLPTWAYSAPTDDLSDLELEEV
jgi:PDDEXK-like domain of unknown function (DUF3799)